MTLATILSLATARGGDKTPSAAETNRARAYLNVVGADAENLARWRFLYKNADITTVAAQRSYSLAADCAYPLNIWDYTNDRPMRLVHPEDIDRGDPDQDEDGEARYASVTGVNSVTGLWEVDLFPTPDTDSETVKYRYYAFWPDFTSDDDDTDLLTQGYPRHIQNVLLWGTSALYFEEKTRKPATEEWGKHQISLAAALKVNGALNVQPRVLMNRPDEMRKLTLSFSITGE